MYVCVCVLYGLKQYTKDDSCTFLRNIKSIITFNFVAQVFSIKYT